MNNLETFDDEAEQMYGMAYILIKQEQYQKAEEIFSLIVNNHPGVSRYVKALGLCFMSQKKYQQALVHLNKALELDQKDDVVLQACAECYWLTRNLAGHHEKACHLFKQLKVLMKRNPKNQNANKVIQKANAFLQLAKRLKK